MAITTIDNLTEKTTAVGTDDMLLIAEKNGDTYTTKKINANAVGGGGGGAEDFVVEFTFNPEDDWATTSNKTFAQVTAAYQQGKNLKGKGTLTAGFEGDVQLICTTIASAGVTFFSMFGGGAALLVTGTAEGWTTLLLQ